MERVTEPELMDEHEQAQAYAQADFEEAHNRFVTLAGERLPKGLAGAVLDLGCGPGDISMRFARAFPACTVHGVDGAHAMLRWGRDLLARTPDLAARVELIHGMLPGAELPRERYDAVISNSLLHHLHDPQVLWSAVRAHAAPGAPVFIMDLMRPPTTEAALALVKEYAFGEPEVLQRDFYNSLLAAFEPGEVREQLAQAELSFAVEEVSDRHLLVTGAAPR